MTKLRLLFILALPLLLTSCIDSVKDDTTDKDSDNQTNIQYIKAEYDPNDVTAHVITFTTDKGDTPSPIALADGASIKQSQLPALTAQYFNLEGWYYNDTKITEGYKVTSDMNLVANWVLTGYDYKTTDTTEYVFPTSNTSYFSTEELYTKGKSTSSSNSIHNWMLNYQSKQFDNVMGFEGQIKLTSNTTKAGFQWVSKNSYDLYWFEILNDGTFKIETDISSTWKTILSLKSTETGITATDYNTIKVISLANADVEVYLNNTLVYTINKADLILTPGRVAYAFQSKSNTSTSNPSYAWFRILNFQQIK